MKSHNYLVILLVIVWIAQSTRCQDSVTILGADTPASALFMHDTILSYQLVQPNVTLSILTGLSESNNELMFTTSLSLTQLQQDQYPNLSTYPFLGAAIVPIYRLDALGTSALPIVFTRSVLAQIYAGNITHWNDPQIQDWNPTLELPQQNIIVVFDNISSINNGVFVDALCQFYTPICSVVAISNQPAWPVSNYSSYRSALNESGVAATVTTIDGSIGYTILSIALNYYCSIGSMVNKAGYTVMASSSSVGFAMVDLAGGSNSGSFDLNDPPGASSWPISVISSLLIDRETSRDTCAIRQATVEYWLYIYQSSDIPQLAQARGYSLLPDLLLEVYGIINDLETQILCEGQVVVTTSISQMITIGGTNHLSFLTNMLVNLYDQGTYSATSINYEYLPLTSQVAWDKLSNAELDVAIFYQNELSSAALETQQSTSDFLIIPMFLTSITFLFNPQITPNLNIGSESLTLDFPTYLRMLCFNITDWKDPSILKYNPSLKSQLGNRSAPITAVNGCETTELNTLIYEWGAVYGAAFDPSLAELWVSLASSPLAAGFENCITILESNVIYLTTDNTIPAVVSTLTGAIGYGQDVGGFTSGVFTIIYPYETNGIISNSPRTSSPETMLACLDDTFTASTLSVNPRASNNPTCWPFTLVASVAVRASYTAAATDSSNCQSGLESLQLVQWLATLQLLDLTTTTQSSPRTTMLPNIKTAVVNALNAVTCDGSTILITLPVIWSLTSAANRSGLAMSVLGLTGILMALTLVTLYRNHPAIRSTSPWFVLTSLSGIALMLVAVFFWVSETTVANCNAFNWCVNLGFILTFAPLFAKTWRIYRIFGRKKLSVIKITNRKLSLMVLGIISTEIVILSIWQGVGPLHPVVTTQTTGSPPLEHVYTQCGTTEDGSKMLIVVGISKGALMLYGALLALSTRRVTDHFNESQSIAWAIYNVVFSVGIIVLIILFIQPVGDAMTLLVMFVILWISYVTAAIITVPKILAVFAPATQLDRAELSSTKSSVGGFSFVSVTEMAEPVLLMQYQSALREQLKQVTQKLELLNGNKNGIKTEKSILSPARDSRGISVELPQSKVVRPQLVTVTSPTRSTSSLGTQPVHRKNHSISGDQNTQTPVAPNATQSPHSKLERGSSYVPRDSPSPAKVVLNRVLLPGESDTNESK